MIPAQQSAVAPLLPSSNGRPISVTCQGSNCKFWTTFRSRAHGLKDSVKIVQSLVMVLPRFFNFERPQLSPKAKLKNLSQEFVAMNMMNNCAKFYEDSLSGKNVKFNLPSVIPPLSSSST